MRTIYAIGAAMVAAGLAFLLWPKPPEPKPVPSGRFMVQVTVPPLGPEATLGQKVFNDTCAACHGENGAGLRGVGPPLIHRIYEPGHHADFSFLRAVQAGVQQHHWPFGDMPAQPQISERDLTLILAFIRTVQKANGIF